MRSLVLAWLALTMLSPIYAVLNWRLVSPVYGGIVAALLGVSLANLAWLRERHRVAASAQVVTACLLLVLSCAAWFGAGPVDPAISWFLVVPLASAFWVGLRSAFGWMLLCAATIVGLHAAEGLGLRPEDRVDAAFRATYRLLGQLLALPAVLAVAGAFLTAQRRLEHSLRSSRARIQQLALADPLTALPNRRAFLSRLDESLAAARRRGDLLAILFLDLDGFKDVNDALGHETGDALLRQVGLRLLSCVRPSDAIGRMDGGTGTQEGSRGGSGSIARIGGDEFTVLIEGLKRPEDAAVPARRINLALRRPFRLLGQEVYVRASIGIVLHPLDGHDAEALMRRADLAMHEAKARGRDGFCFYEEDLDRTARVRVQIEGRLRHALDHGRLSLHFQPICDAHDGRTVGAEALLRWTDTELGEVPPSTFIPVAEQCGLAREVDRLVVGRACEAIRAWADAGLRPVRVAVNVSSRALRGPELAEEVSRALREHQTSPDLIDLEITESSVMTDDPTSRANVASLAALGVGIVLDDFGTGFSSLSHLRHLPVDRLKIDRSFVAEVDRSLHDRSLVECIVSLGRSLRVSVVAEGVETEAQLQALRELGCDAVQGWLISRAVPADVFARFLETDGKEEP